MKSAVPKVLHQVCGLPMIEHVLRSGDALRPASTTVVVGHGADLVRDKLATRPSVSLVIQEPQLGTGHALLQAERPLAGRRGTLVVLSGDAPLLRPGTLERLVDTHTAKGAAATVLTASVADPTGYGRIVRQDGRHRVDRRASRRERGDPPDRRNQQQHLRFRSRAAVRGATLHRLRERAGGVLPAGPRPPVSQARARRRDGGSRRSHRDSRRQQPQ